MATVETIGGVLALFTPVITFILDTVGDIFTMILSQPLLIIPIAVVMLFTVIATVKRFI